MPTDKSATLYYKRSRFVAHLPVEHLYTPSHAWLARQADGAWRIGITRFATRMLGEMVECGFEVEPGAAVVCGQIVGWVEGFKAISDVFCVVDGSFAGANAVLKEKISLVNKDPHFAGWLYEARGTPDPKTMDVHAYVKLLDRTIDKILEKQKTDEGK